MEMIHSAFQIKEVALLICTEHLFGKTTHFLYVSMNLFYTGERSVKGDLIKEK